MKKYQYLASWDDQTLTRVGEPVVVLGDSNVSQVEVTLPSDFLLDPTKAECRMYFLLPGEKESNHDVLETAVKDGNGDSHVTWTIKHVHSQKGGRLAFSLTLIGDDAQWDSRTAIIPVYESRYQPESEEAEKPYTGRLDALEGSMAAIRGEFAEVQEDFEDIKETATLGTPIPESLVANMTEGHVYIYTGTEPGYTAGHVYYYVGGALTDGGVYGGTAVDATLTQSGQAADAKVTGDKIAEIKEDLSAIQTATAEDVGKALKAKTVLNGKVTEWEFGESGSGLSDDIKSALLQIAQKVTYADENGMTYYNELRNALYPPAELVRIVATYTQSKTVYITDKLDVLIDDLTVRAVWSDDTSTTLSNSDYALSGTLTEGESTITVSYEDKTATFVVTVTYKEGQRYLTINDVVERTGITNMVISNGTVSFDSVATFSIYEIDPSVLPLITSISGGALNIVSDKIDERNYIGYDSGGKRFRFTESTSGTSYSATQESGDGEKIATGTPTAPYVVDIVNGALTLTGANNSGKIEYTHANCFGIWCSDNINNKIKLTNCEVNYDGSI